MWATKADAQYSLHRALPLGYNEIAQVLLEQELKINIKPNIFLSWKKSQVYLSLLEGAAQKGNV